MSVFEATKITVAKCTVAACGGHLDEMEQHIGDINALLDLWDVVSPVVNKTQNELSAALRDKSSGNPYANIDDESEEAVEAAYRRRGVLPTD